MSRTIRRNRDNKKSKQYRRYYGDISWWTHDWNRDENGCWVKTKKEGKDFWRGYWRFHGDRIKSWAYPKDLRKSSHREARAKNRVEIIRYYKDDEYEVMEHWPRDLSWDV